MLLDPFELVYTFHPSLGSLFHHQSIPFDQQVAQVFLEDESIVILQKLQNNEAGPNCLIIMQTDLFWLSQNKEVILSKLLRI